MTTVNYKILFEVLLLHEYYLTGSDQTSVFDAANIKDPHPYLANCLMQDRPSVNDILQFIPTPSTQQALDNAGMRLVPGYSGFQIAVKVNPSTQADGSVTYTPLIPIANTLNLLFLLQPVDSSFTSITNSRRKRQAQTLYYFSNSPLAGAKTFPTLSNPVPAKITAAASKKAAATPVYEQGELVNDKNAIKAYYFDGKADQFDPVTGNGYVNEADRILTSPQFNYSFLPSDAILTATFTLKDSSGKTVRTIQAQSTTTLTTVSLDFTVDDNGNPLALTALPAAAATDNILYTLNVAGTGSYKKTLPLIFYTDTQDLPNTWGLIHLQANVGAGSNFNFLDAKGQLLTRQNADGTMQPPPSFQLRCKSLFEFRRYINDSGLSLAAPGPSLTSFLQRTGDATNGYQVTTLKPLPLTYLPWFFSPDPTATPPVFTYVPGPGPGDGFAFINNQFLSIISVPESKLFPTS